MLKPSALPSSCLCGSNSKRESQIFPLFVSRFSCVPGIIVSVDLLVHVGTVVCMAYLYI